MHSIELLIGTVRDEADVFLESRVREANQERNALVSGQSSLVGSIVPYRRLG